MTNRFNRDFALVQSNGRILAESHNVARLEALRCELADEGIIAAVIKSDLPQIPFSGEPRVTEHARRA